jgi:hypothetical protein
VQIEAWLKSLCETERSKFISDGGQDLQLRLRGTRASARGNNRAARLDPALSKFSFPTPTVGKSFDRAVYRFMTQFGLHYLVEVFQRSGTPIPGCDELAATLRDRVIAEAPHRVVSGYGGRLPGHLVSVEWLERSSVTAAEFVLDVYDPGYLVRASAGGRKHRPRMKRFRSLDLLAFSPTLSAQDIADRLGCSLATVYRLRAELLQHPPRPIQTPSEFDELLEP